MRLLLIGFLCFIALIIYVIYLFFQLYLYGHLSNEEYRAMKEKRNQELKALDTPEMKRNRRISLILILVTILLGTLGAYMVHTSS